ncbi:hypothetical protein PDN30_26265 [Bacillus cereus]|nr:hypothetical protein [Bacillus cereus]
MKIKNATKSQKRKNKCNQKGKKHSQKCVIKKTLFTLLKSLLNQGKKHLLKIIVKYLVVELLRDHLDFVVELLRNYLGL